MKIFGRLAERLERRSRAVAPAINRSLPWLGWCWAVVFTIAALWRLFASPPGVAGTAGTAELLIPYILVGLAPLAGFSLARATFPHGAGQQQPAIRLALFGKWRKLSAVEARSRPLFGPAGFMASLLIGLLVNVVLRSGEFLLAMPALGSDAPMWGRQLFLLLAADVIVMNFFYAASFAMALRTVPLFPRMLAFVWLLDITAQLLIARHIGSMPYLPGSVAEALVKLLDGNIQKVLISAFVWLPYLLLSERVNVTYRHREDANAKPEESRRDDGH